MNDYDNGEHQCDGNDIGDVDDDDNSDGIILVMIGMYDNGYDNVDHDHDIVW